MGRRRTITETNRVPTEEEKATGLFAFDEEDMAEQCPWACGFVRVEGGWIVFEDSEDLKRFLMQK